MRGRHSRTAEEIAAIAVLKNAAATREKAARQAKRVRRAYAELLKALLLTVSEENLAAVEKAVTTEFSKFFRASPIAPAGFESGLDEKPIKAPQVWDKIETSVEDEPETQEAAE